MIRNFITILILPNNYLHSFSEEAISKLNKLKIESSSTLISYHNLFDRGYTGHEHLTKFGLINMNGRTYDPWLGRMLQPDNYVQAAGYLQNYNRYSYCYNNPLRYTDPSGEFVQFIIGGVIGGISGYMIGKSAGLTGGGLVLTTFAGAVIGAGTAGIGTAISSSVGGAGGTILAGATSGAASTASYSSLSVAANGGNLNDMGIAHLDGVWKGTITGAAGSLVGGAYGGGQGTLIGGGVSGGISAALNGGNGQEIIMGAAYGGLVSFGTYHLTTSINYYRGGRNIFPGEKLSYRQFNILQADFQRSVFWRREFGGYFVEGGGVKGRVRGSNMSVDLGEAPENAIAEYHMHWDKPGTVRIANKAGFYYRNENHVAKSTNLGQQAEVYKTTVSQYHNKYNDFDTNGLPSYIINRIDASYYSGYGNDYSIHSPIVFRNLMINTLFVR